MLPVRLCASLQIVSKRVMQLTSPASDKEGPYPESAIPGKLNRQGINCRAQPLSDTGRHGERVQEQVEACLSARAATLSGGK